MAQEIADSKLLDTWGSSGTKIEPDISKIIEGWQLGEQPPHEYMNWLQNIFGSKLNHILKNGVATWNNETEYLAGSSVQHNGNVWLCETTNTNSEPTDLNANWGKVAINKDLTVPVDTLADLRSISYPAATVWASGYHTKNDGAFGSHIFRLKGVKTTEVDNSGTVIIATIGGTDYVYELQYDGAVNVKWFGAKGDGITDDTIAIQSTVNSIQNDKDYVIFVPVGEYICTSSIKMVTNTSLLGAEVRVYNLYVGENSPKMSMLKFINDTDGLVFDNQFFKNMFKNIAIWCGVPGGTSTKVGLRLSREDATLVNDTTWDGIGNIYENFLVYGFKTGIKISGAYSWHQKFRDFQIYNCLNSIDIETRSSHQLEFTNYYLNANPTGSFDILTTKGVIMRHGGRTFLNNGLIETIAIPIVFDTPIYSDLPNSAIMRDVTVNELYTEGFTQSVFKFFEAGILNLNNIKIPYPLGNANTSLIGLFYKNEPNEITNIYGKLITASGGLYSEGRILAKLITTNAIAQPSHYNIVLEEVSMLYNDFISLWEVGRPPNRLTIREPDNAGNSIEFIQNTSDRTRAFAVIKNSNNGYVSINSLKWTTTKGTLIDVNSMFGQLSSIDPVRVFNKQKLPIYYGNIADVNGTTKSSRSYSGVRYVNYGANTSITLIIEVGSMNIGDEFIIMDSPDGNGATCSITIGSQTIVNTSKQFVVIRKVAQDGALTADRFVVISRGAV